MKLIKLKLRDPTPAGEVMVKFYLLDDDGFVVKMVDYDEGWSYSEIESLGSIGISGTEAEKLLTESTK